jgi:hypothetical protein
MSGSRKRQLEKKQLIRSNFKRNKQLMILVVSSIDWWWRRRRRRKNKRIFFWHSLSKKQKTTISRSSVSLFSWTTTQINRRMNQVLFILSNRWFTLCLFAYLFAGLWLNNNILIQSYEWIMRRLLLVVNIFEVDVSKNHRLIWKIDFIQKTQSIENIHCLKQFCFNEYSLMKS